MKRIALELSLLITLFGGASAGAAPLRTLHFRDGIDVAFSFERGPAVSPDMRFESVALIEVAYGSRDTKRVRDVVFDATMDMGRYTHALTNNRPPLAEAAGRPDTWQVRNIFFTMEMKWEGKLTLRFDDGTAETQHFPINVRPR